MSCGPRKHVRVRRCQSSIKVGLGNFGGIQILTLRAHKICIAGDCHATCVRPKSSCLPLQTPRQRNIPGILSCDKFPTRARHNPRTSARVRPVLSWWMTRRRASRAAHSSRMRLVSSVEPSSTTMNSRSQPSCDSTLASVCSTYARRRCRRSSRPIHRAYSSPCLVQPAAQPSHRHPPQYRSVHFIQFRRQPIHAKVCLRASCVARRLLRQREQTP